MEKAGSRGVTALRVVHHRAPTRERPSLRRAMAEGCTLASPCLTGLRRLQALPEGCARLASQNLASFSWLLF